MCLLVEFLFWLSFAFCAGKKFEISLTKKDQKNELLKDRAS